MASPQLEALAQAVANLSAASQSAVNVISAHAAVSVDPAQLANFAAQVQAATDAINQAVAANPAPPAA
ncbi:hypothetical protein QM467_04685 [Rhodoblastus sp. 17X3]|uniref:hypothetical protein n=1 Tax=Rhodoblastus sp. 17X3 TaxID=3047026 RepID=UPI0024B6B33A|nr:hypothetical protein [Rhodoblastus sp. 17X3]MDI9847356.1 hypothetical protein [Rhodoblastus sp. 17X3]